MGKPSLMDEGTARRDTDVENPEPEDAPEGKEASTEEDRKLPDDQEEMQPDSS